MNARGVARPFRSEADFLRVRNLLIETHSITPTGFNWEIRRWDGWRFYRDDPSWDPRWESQVGLWETEAGVLVGAVHPEGIGGAHLQVHPDFRQLEEEMIAWAEEHLSIETRGRRRLDVFVFDYDSPRRQLLERRGFRKTEVGGVTRRSRLGNRTIPRAELADGYVLRSPRPEDESDCQRIADLLNAAFRRDCHTAAEFRVFSAHAACYRRDLDLVAVAPDGSFASYVGVPYDEANRCGIFEPVCTHPDHAQRGLGRALMLEALRRLEDLGAAEALVGTGDAEAANRLYESVGFTEACRGHVWRKTFVPPHLCSELPLRG